MQKSFFLLIFTLIILSCSKQENEINVSLDEQTMANIMSDMSKAYFLSEIADEKDKVQIRDSYKHEICQHYGTTIEVYEKDLKTYIDNPKYFKRIIDKAQK